MLNITEENKKTIGLDLDDTLIDHSLNRQKLSQSLNLNPESKELKKILYSEISLSAEPMKYSLESVRKFIELGYKIIIVSRRKKDGHKSARAWLKKYLPQIPASKIFFVEEDKDKNIICLREKVDIFIDDSIEVISSLDQSIEKILFRKNWREISEKVATNINPQTPVGRLH